MIATRTLVCPILVGRDDLLELADRRIAEVAAGRGRLLLLGGEAGVGKTRLVGAIGRRAAAAGFRTVRGGTYPSDLQVPAAILIDLGRAMRRTTEFAALGARLVERLEEPTSGRGDAHRRRRLLVLDLADLVAEAGRDTPTMITLEDLHWSDDLTLEIVEALARRVPDLPLLVVGTYRSDELFPRVPMREWRARLVNGRLAEEARLSRLSPDDTATMTSLLSASELPAPRDVAEAVHARTDGIPLHVEELMALLAESGLPPAGSVRGADVPDTVEEAILTRLEARSPAALEIARAGAVIGRSFDLDLLAAVEQVEPGRLSEPLSELTDHFVLLPAHQPGRYGFRHALICDAIYDRIPEPERRRLHGLAADAAAGTDVGTDAFLALHYERAGRRAEAFAAALAGGRAATAMSSHGEARALYDIAVRTAPDDLSPADRGRLLEAHGGAAAATDDNATAAASFLAAREAYLAAGERLAAAAVTGPLVSARHLLGDGLETRAEVLRGALAEIDSAPGLHGTSLDPASDRVRGRLLGALSAAYMLDRRLDESITYGTEARRLASLGDDLSTDLNAAATLGSCLVFAGRFDEGWPILEDAIGRGLAAGLDAETARGYRMLGSCASVLVEYERAERWLRDGIAYAEGTELWNHRHYMAAHLGHVLWATGQWPSAEEVARHALADGRGGITTRITALHVLGYVALGQGRFDEARATLGEARDAGGRMGELQRLSPALWGLAETALLAGDPAEAVVHAERGLAASLAVADAAYLYPFVVTGVRANLAAGDPHGARGWLERTAPSIEARRIPGTLPALDHGRGLIALSDGNTAQARDALTAAAAGWDARVRAWEGAWVRLDLARAHLRANQRLDAGRQAELARAAADRLGSPPLQAAADELLAGLRRGGGPEPWAPLTAREFEVARLVAAGRTNAEIADEIGVTRKTAASHVEHILAKLGVARRAEIAAWTAARPVLHSRPHGEDREE